MSILLQSPLDALRDYVHQPSVSADNNFKEGVNGARKYATERLEELGFDVNLIQTPINPIILATRGDPSWPRLVIYGHYDVQPPDPLDLWESDPFNAVERNGRIYGRGAADMKSSISAFLFALKDIDLSKNRKKISILLTSNEEGDSKDGTIEKVLDELKQNNNAINYCLAGEPSSKNELGDTVRIGRRGSLSGSLTIVL